MQVEAYVLTPRIVGKAIQIPGSLVLIGESMGAARAEALAARFPERYTRLVLVGSPETPSPDDLRSAVKQGGRQMNKDKVAKIMTSVGSEMRRNNEKILQEHII